MSFFELAVHISIIIIGISLLLIFVRLVIGPTIADRIVALDLIAANVIGFVAVYGITAQSTTFLDVGITLALIAFLGTAAFAYYLERRSKK
jgi:multicomponent Na+:H+ antiporter subunit F